MTRVRLGILQSVAAATLVACEGCGPSHAPPAVVAAPASAVPRAAPSSSVKEGTAAVVVPAHQRIFRPGEAGVDLSFGRFGHPCDLEDDPGTHVVMLQCGRVDAPDESGITVNFYLPGIWQSGPLTTERVATMIRDNAGAQSHVEGAFEAPDRETGQSVYFLTMSAVYADGGQAFIIKVAALDRAVYSVSYTTMFSGPSDTMPAKNREWLAAHLTEYGPEIGGLLPDPSWVPYLRSKFEGAHGSR